MHRILLQGRRCTRYSHGGVIPRVYYIHEISMAELFRICLRQISFSLNSEDFKRKSIVYTIQTRISELGNTFRV
jgi:hypothetical protein